MADNVFEVVAYLEEALERVTQQFVDKPVFAKYLELLLTERLEIQDVLKDLMQLRSLETATGANLDLIGEIVGQVRLTIDSNPVQYFGFSSDFAATGFPLSDDNDADGAPFYEGALSTGPFVLQSDDEYRVYIKARILRNVIGISPEEVIEYFSFLFDTTIKYEETSVGAIRIGIGKVLSPFEAQFLAEALLSDSGGRLYPKAVGVYYEFYENV